MRYIINPNLLYLYQIGITINNGQLTISTKIIGYCPLLSHLPYLEKALTSEN
jgi:hypothetical protein